MIFILLIFAYKVFQIKKIIKNQKKEIYHLLIFSLVGLILWFLKFPLYRYGVSYLVIFIICISVILFNNLNFSVLKKREIIYITVFCYFIFIGVNLNRIVNKFYLHEDLPNIYFMGKNISYQKKIINNQYYYYADSECLYNKNLCTHLDVSVRFKNKFGYKIFY